jgi:hypothetical protein
LERSYVPTEKNESCFLNFKSLFCLRFKRITYVLRLQEWNTGFNIHSWTFLYIYRYSSLVMFLRKRQHHTELSSGPRLEPRNFYRILLKYISIELSLKTDNSTVHNIYRELFNSRDSSVGIPLGYGLNDRGSRVRFRAGAGNFPLHHRVQNGSGTHPASYNGYQGLFPWGWSDRGVKLTTHLYLVPRSKNVWSYTSTLPIPLSRGTTLPSERYSYKYCIWSHQNCWFT